MGAAAERPALKALPALLVRLGLLALMERTGSLEYRGVAWRETEVGAAPRGSVDLKVSAESDPQPSRAGMALVDSGAVTARRFRGLLARLDSRFVVVMGTVGREASLEFLGQQESKVRRVSPDLAVAAQP